MHPAVRTHPGIGAHDADNLAERILMGDAEIPELGLTRNVLRRSRNPGNDVLSRAERALCGERRFHRACMHTVMEMPNRISTALLHLLAHGRCDALAWIILTPHVEAINLPGPMGGLTVMSRSDHELPGRAGIADTHVFLGNGAYWTGEGTLDLTPDLPETALTAAIGRPLSSLVSHPALDGIPMRIEAIDGNGADGRIITTDYAGWSMFRRSVALSEILPIHLHPVLAFG